MNFQTIHLKETESTNTYAKALLKSGELSAPFTLIYTDNQTKGRGRMGRNWDSKEGDTLCMSLIVPYPHKPAITLLSALAVYNTLKEYRPDNLLIKWPNDIIAANKKLCGILTESTDKAAVIGIGINLNTTSFSQEIAHKATSLKLLTNHTYSPFELAQKIAENLIEILLKTNGEFIPSAQEEYTSLCANIGKEIEFRGINGVATGIDFDGSLLAEVENKTEKISSGEVFVSGIY